MRADRSGVKEEWRRETGSREKLKKKSLKILIVAKYTKHKIYHFNHLCVQFSGLGLDYRLKGRGQQRKAEDREREKTPAKGLRRS